MSGRHLDYKNNYEKLFSGFLRALGDFEEGAVKKACPQLFPVIKEGNDFRTMPELLVCNNWESIKREVPVSDDRRDLFLEAFKGLNKKFSMASAPAEFEQRFTKDWHDQYKLQHIKEVFEALGLFVAEETQKAEDVKRQHLLRVAPLPHTPR